MKILSHPFDSALILKKRKSIRNELISSGGKRIKKNIAILGGSTTNDIVEILELFLLNYDIEPLFYISEYGQYWADAVFENEKLAAFKPDIIYIHTTSRNLHIPPLDMRESSDSVNKRLNEQYSHFEIMWEKLKSNYSCTIIQNNFEALHYRILGNMDAHNCHGGNWFVNSMNMKLYEYARRTENFYINDINYISASFGLDKWSDLSAWYLYKYALSISAIPEFSYNLANIIKSVCGKNKKALAIDLDNTLWGGVIGEDGLSGIEIGLETASGSAYYEFQSYLSQLRSLGITLNICSKNDENAAIEGLSHPENILKAGDFLIIMANWNNKDENILQIAEKLNILPESIVFIDDNPAERALVEENLKSTAVPEMLSPESYIKTIDKCAFFEPTILSTDDFSRNEMYKKNLERDRLSASFRDYGEYLKSLEMTAIIRSFEPVCLERVTQLINKSNQFNLTTKRYTLSEIKEISQNKNYITLYGKLLDKFGDNGIVSALIGRIDEDILHIDLFLMSCRVLKRNMEFAMLDKLVFIAARRNIKSITGYYFKTEKNHMVENLFRDFGFSKASDASNNDDTVWELNTEGYINKNKVIKIKEYTENE